MHMHNIHACIGICNNVATYMYNIECLYIKHVDAYVAMCVVALIDICTIAKLNYFTIYNISVYIHLDRCEGIATFTET